MGTGLDGSPEPDTQGIIPRALAHLAGALLAGPGPAPALYVSFIEVYNEEVVDLLGSAQRGAGRRRVCIREDARGDMDAHTIAESLENDPLTTLKVKPVVLPDVALVAVRLWL